MVVAATKKIKKYRDRSKKGLPRAVHFKKAGLTSSDRDTLIKVKKTIPVNAGDNRTVSYTHLDVYKRQIDGRR